MAAEAQPIFFIGTSGWTYDHWKGRFYPRDLPKSRWLEFYASRLPAVEINATFYHLFPNQTYIQWGERVPQGFGYVLKVPREITHRRYLLDVEIEIELFARSCTLLGDHFKMVLLQVAPGTPYDLGRLESALQAFPDPSRVAVEFRHPHWYTAQTENLLHRWHATFCNVDAPQHPLTDRLTSDRAYLRLHGRGRWYSYLYSNDELKEIAKIARQLSARGAKRVYIFFNNDVDAHAPANALALSEMLS